MIEIGENDPTVKTSSATEDEEVNVTVTMPAVLWTMVLGILEPTVIETAKQLAGRRFDMAGLSEEQIFVLTSPGYARGLIVDAMAAAEQMTPEAKAKVGSEAYLKNLEVAKGRMAKRIIV